ncbi:MAG: hypothetical protein E7173_03680 [Firmicutes bacterium]|nr:hypothetical protein [Bacillota bacterium]
MGEKYLTLEQNICAARIFLNTFGFILEDVEELNEFSKIKIYDKSMNDVGQLCFNNGKVIMAAKYSRSTLTARYDIAKIFGFVDIESNNAIFGQWSSKIDFQIENNTTNINGQFVIANTVDSQFGISCRCHNLMTLNTPDKGDITLRILRDGCVFYFEFNTENYNETIEFKPISEFIRHVITKGEYNQAKHQYPYRKYVGVFNAAENGEDKDKLNMFLSEEQDGNLLNYRRDLVEKVDKDNYREMNIQRGLLMKQLDSDMLEKVQLLREMFTIDGVSLLDNLISVCYDSYTDEELVALLGTERPTPVYQDGSGNLTDSYFGIGKENKFLSLEQQKRLLKK